MALDMETRGAWEDVPAFTSRQTSHALRNLYHDATADEPGPEVTIPFQEYWPRRIAQYSRGYLTARDLAPGDIRTLALNDGTWPAPQAWPLAGEGPVGFDEDAPVSLRGGVMALVAGVSFGAGLFLAWTATWVPAVAAGVPR